MTESVKGSGC